MLNAGCGRVALTEKGEIVPEASLLSLVLASSTYLDGDDRGARYRGASRFRFAREFIIMG